MTERRNKMKEFKISIGIILFLLCLTTLCFGAPFLVSDPYPGPDNQPDGFLVVEQGKPDTPVPLVKNEQNLNYFRWDLAGVSKGTHNLTIYAESATWGRSDPVPFVLSIGILPPTNIRLTK